MSNPLHYVIPEQPMHWRRRLLWALPLLLVAAIPLVIYIDSANNILAFMILMLIGTHIIVDLQVLLLANEVASRLRKMTGNLDLLLLTGIDTRRLIFSQWWLILRLTWVNALPLIVLRLGTAWAIAQYLHIGAPWTVSVRSFDPLTIEKAVMRPFFYFSHDLIYPGYSKDYEHWYPLWVQVGLALFIIIIGIACELGLVAAIGIWSSYLRLKFSGAAVRVLIVLVVTALMVPVYYLGEPVETMGSRVQADIYCYNRSGDYAPNSPWECPDIIYKNWIFRVIDTTQIAVWTLADNSPLLAANLLRPNLSHHYQMDTLGFQYAQDVTTLPVEPAWSYLGVQWHISGWRFIARMLAAAGLSLLLYAALTYGFLRAARMRLR